MKPIRNLIAISALVIAGAPWGAWAQNANTSADKEFRDAEHGRVPGEMHQNPGATSAMKPTTASQHKTKSPKPPSAASVPHHHATSDTPHLKSGALTVPSVPSADDAAVGTGGKTGGSAGGGGSGR
jgi:hypothetical protein